MRTADWEPPRTVERARDRAWPLAVPGVPRPFPLTWVTVPVLSKPPPPTY